VITPKTKELKKHYEEKPQERLGFGSRLAGLMALLSLLEKTGGCMPEEVCASWDPGTRGMPRTFRLVTGTHTGLEGQQDEQHPQRGRNR
jgi:hypothetical protein